MDAFEQPVGPVGPSSSRIMRLAAWFAAGAVVVVAALAGAAALVAGPSPSPSVAGVASPPASPSVVVPSVLVAPSRTPGGIPFHLVTPSPQPSVAETVPPTYAPGELAALAPSWRVNLVGADATHPVVAVVDDPLQRVVGAGVADPRFFTSGFKQGIEPGASDSALDIYWTGTTCDGWAEVGLSPNGGEVTITTVPRVTSCTPHNQMYGLELRFGAKVNPMAYSLTMAKPGRYTNDPGGWAVAFWDATHGLAVTSAGVAIAAETFDGGEVWHLVPVSDGWATGVAVSGSTAWMGIACDTGGWDHCAPGVYRREGGAWTRVAAMVPGALAASGSSVAVLEQSLVDGSLDVTRLATGIRSSDDWGSTWSSIGNPCPFETPGLSAIAFSDRGLMVVCEGESSDGSADKVLLTAAAPYAVWTATSLPRTGANMRLSMAPAASSGSGGGRTGLLWSYGSPLLVTADGGVTWTARRNVANGTTRIVSSGDAWPGGGGVIAVDDLDRAARLLLTSPDGKAWTEMTSFADPPCCGG